MVRLLLRFLLPAIILLAREESSGRLYQSLLLTKATPQNLLTMGSLAPSPRAAHNIILFIGDGMGEVQRTAARWTLVGPGGKLSMDKLPAIGWAMTKSANSAVTDSAAAATALSTGFKTNNGMIGVLPDGSPRQTILEQAQDLGMAVGLVTTVQMAHATPAAFVAHVPDRSMMTEIARQMLAAQVDVLLGGGEDEFLPAGETGCFPQPGIRSDGRNLVDEAVNSGYVFVCDAAELAAVDPLTTDRVLGLFADDGMLRPYSPSLADMTHQAIAILSKDAEGFFLMVEGGQIDWAGHNNDAANVITDTLGFDAAVSVGLEYASINGDTLIIVTADHETGGMRLASSTGDEGPFPIPGGSAFYVNWSTTGHTAADVGTSAGGPLSSQLNGTYENTHVYNVMAKALFAWKVFLPQMSR